MSAVVDIFRPGKFVMTLFSNEVMSDTSTWSCRAPTVTLKGAVIHTTSVCLTVHLFLNQALPVYGSRCSKVSRLLALADGWQPFLWILGSERAGNRSGCWVTYIWQTVSHHESRSSVSRSVSPMSLCVAGTLENHVMPALPCVSFSFACCLSSDIPWPSDVLCKVGIPNVPAYLLLSNVL